MSSAQRSPRPPKPQTRWCGLTVVDPGWATRIVDGGRPGSRSLGVPVGGAADRASWMLGNALVGNLPEAPALEIAMKGPVLRAECDVGCVVFGAPFDLSSARQALRTGRTFTLTAGEELHIGGTPRNMRAYFCVVGGIQCPTILGSASSFDAIRRGAKLACATSGLYSRFLHTDHEFDVGFADTTSQAILHVTPGPQANWFATTEFYEQTFVIAPAGNRMGLRLQGKPLCVPARELLSEPVCPGAVQVTKDGQCIILGVDGQTIGGYPKIAQVIRADLDTLGQLRPGDKIGFQPVELPAAIELERQRRAALLEWITRMRVSLEMSRQVPII